MDQKPLLDVIEEVAARMRLIEHERDEAVARAQVYQRQVIELASLVNNASAKLQGMLKADEFIEMPQDAALLEFLHEFSPDPTRYPGSRLPGAPGQG
jgi:hypothetical protein